ncbi:EAL domain-containing protein [Mycolicibacterium hodleri]|uniref:EAL domain-containing protein n=1 Tax=Mycolicibacterium hodleri TaxID=49897 RepID=A0A502E4D1_9MYCO|nr:EAL domain-containing protein [Mycolicibacterium hodleri]TPG32184.1 EAL domain-containing protein [Mycolicibacterium hodleri]
MSNDSEALWKVVGHEGCETEPINKPDAIQARGWLLAVDLAAGRVSHVSSNLNASISGILVSTTVLGSKFEDVARALQLPDAATQFEPIAGWRTEMPWLTSDPVVVTAHSTSDHYVLEIERDIPSVASDPTAMIATLLEAPSWQAFSEQTVKALGQMFGYARTMAYTFHPDHHGEVTAEYLNQSDLEPFLGLHYPASDIPRQARRLYVMQLVRVIEDVDEPTVHLLGSAPDCESSPALDLSFANRRAVSPVHLEYTRNMGVAATATVSIVQLERLTGMFVMHHTEPRSLSLSDRLALATVSHIASFVSAKMDEKSFGIRRARVTSLAEELRRNLTAGDNAIRCIEAMGDEVLTAVEADGVVARLNGEVFRLGDVPAQDMIDQRVRELNSAGTELVQTTDCLAADMPELAGSDICAGAIVARLPGTPEGYVAWFRRPFLDTVRWGGELTALVRKDQFGRLHPRGSFDEFVENVTDRSRMWSDHDRTVAESLYRALQSGLTEWAYRQLAVLATIDPLTGLGNRRSLSQAIDGATPSRSALRRSALLYLDLDRFKQINDAFGHHMGDLVLQATADRLERETFHLVGRFGAVFRLGGDEFVVLLCDAAPGMVSALADGILAAFRDPVIVDGSMNVVNVSIGAVADADADGIDSNEMLRRGDLAMYSAKRAGGSRVTFYQDDFSHAAVRRSTLEQQLYQAIEHDELISVFQPIVSLRTGQIVGAEALARWRPPVGGILLPAEFILLAEETGQIRQVDQRITERAVVECRGLLRDPSREFHLAINASAKTVDAEYVGYLAELIAHYAFPPERLTVELTESAMVHESGRLRQTLSDIRSLGVKVAIDDFGTGYSSLAHLQNLPVDMVKLDRTFVERLRGDEGANVVARWAIQLVSELGMRMIAEGVETRTEEEALVSLGYDWVQGNRYGAPKLAPPRTSDLESASKNSTTVTRERMTGFEPV